MSYKEAKELRLSGKLEEALTMANQDLENDSSNIWNKRSIAWVYYDYLKKNATKENFETFLDFLNKINALELPDDEEMVFDKCAYKIGKIIVSLAKDEQVDYSKINLMFDTIKNFHFPKPSESYSFLYKAFHKCYRNWSNYLQFADWWNFDNFSPQDYLSEKYKGNEIISIVEQAYIAYSKKLLEGDSYNHSVDKQKMSDFLSRIDAIIEEHPEYQYPPYYKAKLLLSLGNEENALSNFIPFARKKRNDFWVWELLADTFQAEDDRKIACLCKALSLKTPNKFLINIRQKLAELLIKQNKFHEAKTEIENILQTRNDNKWKIPTQVSEWTEQDWYKNNLTLKNNFSFYKQYLESAEDIMFADTLEDTVVVEFVNEDKSIINFVKDKSKYGFFRYSGMIEKPKIGDLINVRFSGEGQNGLYKVLSIKKASEDSVCDAIKDFQGKLKLRESVNFGFVEDVFIEPNLIVKHELKNKDMLEGKAILSFNKKKNEWGWKAIEIY